MNSIERWFAESIYSLPWNPPWLISLLIFAVASGLALMVHRAAFAIMIRLVAGWDLFLTVAGRADLRPSALCGRHPRGTGPPTRPCLNLMVRGYAGRGPANPVASLGTESRVRRPSALSLAQ